MHEKKKTGWLELNGRKHYFNKKGEIDYVTWKYSYYRTYNFKASKGWDKTKALNIFKLMKAHEMAQLFHTPYLIV